MDNTHPTGMLSCFITVRNEVAKVMFLHLSVCPRGGGGSASVHAGIPHSPPRSRHPPGGRHPAGSRHPPSSRRLRLRTVRIVLECILVINSFHYCYVRVKIWINCPNLIHKSIKHRNDLTLLNFYLSLCITQRRKQVEFESSFGAEAVLQMRILVLHRRQRRHQYFCFTLGFFILT